MRNPLEASRNLTAKWQNLSYAQKEPYIERARREEEREKEDTHLAEIRTGWEDGLKRRSMRHREKKEVER